MRRTARLAALTASVALVAAGLTVAPAGAITGGEPDGDGHPNVALITWYSADKPGDTVFYRYRCTGTLVSPTVILTAAHCTELTEGKTLVTFRSELALTPPATPDESPIPRADDDTADADGNPTGPDGWGSSAEGFDAGDALKRPGFVAGTSYTHPQYSGFTDLKNWNDVGVVVLDEPVTGVTPAQIAPRNYLNQFTPRILNSTLFRAVGYGTEVRKSPTGPQKPTPQSYPLIRRTTEANGQKLTTQILQTNGNENNTKGGGGTCFGDSGGPSFNGGYVVTVTSYGYTDNCRYIDGLQRVDIKPVQDWLATFEVLPAGS